MIHRRYQLLITTTEHVKNSTAKHHVYNGKMS